MTLLLETLCLSKSYPGVKALDEVDFDLRSGETHILFGENGAGKSTLISLLAGAAVPSAGAIRFRGQEVHLKSVREARLLGINTVFQEFSLIPTLSVTENLFLGGEIKRRGLVDRQAMQQRAHGLLKDLEFDIDPNHRVAQLTRAQQQMVEIAKGLHGRMSVLILDEPTASLTDKETQRLFALIARLKRDGVGIIYISHRIQELDAIADRITVLRDGRKISTVNAQHTNHAALIEMMAGRAVARIYPTITARPGRVVLDVLNVSTDNGVRHASLQARAGEVLGLAGLVGSGKSELLRAIYGLSRITAGRVLFDGVDCTGKSTAKLLHSGFFYLPPDRKSEGLILDFNADANIALPSLATRLKGRFGLLNRQARKKLVRDASERVTLSPHNTTRQVGLLSGGNQQKVLFAKGLTDQARLYVFDEPTVGIDVGTRSALYQLMRQLCETGSAVVLISSDLPEILHLTHRAHVFCAGRIAGELQGQGITESALLKLFFDGVPAQV